MENVEDFDLGEKVKHAKFGTGTVMSKSGGGDNLKVVVKFPEFGEKKLSVKVAKLKKLAERPTLAAAPEGAPVAEPLTALPADAEVEEEEVVDDEELEDEAEEEEDE